MESTTQLRLHDPYKLVVNKQVRTCQTNWLKESRVDIRSRWEIGQAVAALGDTQSRYGSGVIKMFCQRMTVTNGKQMTPALAYRCRQFYDEFYESELEILVKHAVTWRTVQRMLGHSQAARTQMLAEIERGDRITVPERFRGARARCRILATLTNKQAAELSDKAAACGKPREQFAGNLLANLMAKNQAMIDAAVVVNAPLQLTLF